jgi:hypothetical protein
MIVTVLVIGVGDDGIVEAAPEADLAVDTNSIEIVNSVEDTLEVTETEKVTLTTKDKVEEYFSDIPIMAEVSFCESRFRQHDKYGNLLRGKVDSRDVGVMQINEYYHLETAQKLGLDIHTLEGNLAYARYLYNKEGTRPWNASAPCWGKAREVALR